MPVTVATQVPGQSLISASGDGAKRPPRSWLPHLPHRHFRSLCLTILRQPLVTRMSSVARRLQSIHWCRVNGCFPANISVWSAHLNRTCGRRIAKPCCVRMFMSIQGPARCHRLVKSCRLSMMARFRRRTSRASFAILLPEPPAGAVPTKRSRYPNQLEPLSKIWLLQNSL